MKRGNKMDWLRFPLTPPPLRRPLLHHLSQGLFDQKMDYRCQRSNRLQKTKKKKLDCYKKCHSIILYVTNCKSKNCLLTLPPPSPNCHPWIMYAPVALRPCPVVCALDKTRHYLECNAYLTLRYWVKLGINWDKPAECQPFSTFAGCSRKIVIISWVLPPLTNPSTWPLLFARNLQ